MPITKRLVLVRHGQSEGNQGHYLQNNGLGDQLPDSIVGMPGFEWRLTKQGVSEAASAGEWLKQNSKPFDAGIVSPYVRTLETAANLNLGLQWKIENRVRERDWGEYDTVATQSGFESSQNHINECLNGNPLDKPPSGESIVQANDRAALVNDSLARNFSNKEVIIVSHGEMISTLVMSYFRWSLIEIKELRKLWPMLFYPANCQIIEFVRYNPKSPETNDEKLFSHFGWVRCIVPWDPKHKNNMDWTPVTPKKYGDVELQKLADIYPRHLS